MGDCFVASLLAMTLCCTNLRSLRAKRSNPTIPLLYQLAVIASEAKQSHNPVAAPTCGHCERSEAIPQSRCCTNLRSLRAKRSNPTIPLLHQLAVIASEAKQSHNPVTASTCGHCERSEAIPQSRYCTNLRSLRAKRSNPTIPLLHQLAVIARSEATKQPHNHLLRSYSPVSLESCCLTILAMYFPKISNSILTTVPLLIW